MKTSVTYLKISCIIIALLLQTMVGSLYAIINVYTPNCTAVDANTLNIPISPTNITLMNDEMAYQIAYYKWTTATRLDNPTYEYNCHSYAWYLTEGGTVNYWINAFTDADLNNFDEYVYNTTVTSLIICRINECRIESS